MCLCDGNHCCSSQIRSRTILLRVEDHIHHGRGARKTRTDSGGSYDQLKMIVSSRRANKTGWKLTITVSVVGGYLLSDVYGLDNTERDVTAFAKKLDIVITVMLEAVGISFAVR